MTESPRKLPYHQRSRTLPHQYHYLLAIWWATLFYILFLLTLVCAVGFLRHMNQANAYLLIGLVFGTIFVWVLGYFPRRKAVCPLCKGTPFLDSRAAKHTKAFRLPLLNYGATNILRAIVTRRFRCHFCGTPYDMLKQNAKTQNSAPEES